MSERDPAAARFAIIQAVRLTGVACVIGGMIIATGRSSLPDWIGYVLLANGLVDVFVIPPILVRKWRTPK
ncbi:hypothetical protein GCM10011494_14630 [Novosphingobium endophyticum]|uniref:Uncharacterized protein n=1 Tax=Novosphingobium endophyticum TaxID=1955250 RepID=A0A916TTZ4_9SPHN|nr:hypothetical protein [Novosphingobium endophyticum]GGB97232.1 hypothetical protein GCM10011494_14630 [Novosphingobium endophyticum]